MTAIGRLSRPLQHKPYASAGPEVWTPPYTRDVGLGSILLASKCTVRPFEDVR